jgi:hypothetical protein
MERDVLLPEPAPSRACDRSRCALRGHRRGTYRRPRDLRRGAVLELSERVDLTDAIGFFLPELNQHSCLGSCGGGYNSARLITHDGAAIDATENTIRQAQIDASKIQADFDEWYALYPRRVGKAQAFDAYENARKKASQNELIAGAKNAVEQYRETDERYVPHPKTWLAGERWLDEKPDPLRLHKEMMRGAR